MTEVKWLERALIVGPHLCLCTNEMQFRKALEDLKITESLSFIGNKQSDGTCWFFDEEECGKLAAVVCMRNYEDKKIEEIAGLLMHESVHIFQHFKGYIGEHSPSSEFEAYSIQHIFQELFSEYLSIKDARIISNSNP